MTVLVNRMCHVCCQIPAKNSGDNEDEFVKHGDLLIRKVGVDCFNWPAV